MWLEFETNSCTNNGTHGLLAKVITGLIRIITSQGSETSNPWGGMLEPRGNSYSDPLTRTRIRALAIKLLLSGWEASVLEYADHKDAKLFTNGCYILATVSAAPRLHVEVRVGGDCASQTRHFDHASDGLPNTRFPNI